MDNFGLEEIRFSEGDLDAALKEIGIDTALSIDVQRSLASRVLITASLASAISSDARYELAVSQLGHPPADPEEVAFLASFSRSIVDDLREELGDPATGHIGVMARRIMALAA